MSHSCSWISLTTSRFHLYRFPTSCSHVRDTLLTILLMVFLLGALSCTSVFSLCQYCLSGLPKLYLYRYLYHLHSQQKVTPNFEHTTYKLHSNTLILGFVLNTIKYKCRVVSHFTMAICTYSNCGDFYIQIQLKIASLYN